MSIGANVKHQATLATFLVAAALAASTLPAVATNMTAGVVMKEMPAGERAAYVMGIVEGLAYARFRKDTAATGTKDEAGMQCIYRWLYKDSKASLTQVDAAFAKYPDHFPSTLLATMLKKECGE